MPPLAGDNVYAADVTTPTLWSSGQPITRLVQAVAQSIPDNVATALTFTTEEFDAYNFHDPVTNNSRITPTIAGWYEFDGTYMSGTMTTPVFLACWLRKNGAGGIAPAGRTLGGPTTTSASCRAKIYCNGTTDYVELVAQQDSAGAVLTNVSAQYTSVFECKGLRP